MERVEIILPSNTVIAKIGDKKYTITLNEDGGIFIQSDEKIAVTIGKAELGAGYWQGRTGSWLYVEQIKGG